MLVSVDDWVRRERFVFVGWSGLLLLPTAYRAVVECLTNPMVLGTRKTTGFMVVGTRKFNWIIGSGYSQVQLGPVESRVWTRGCFR